MALPLPPPDAGLRVDAGGRVLHLLPERALWLEDSRTLLVADVHLGKAASFRALGVPVPGGTTAATLERLARVVAALAPRRLVVLGDLLHGPTAQHAGAVDALAHWRARHAALDVVLVRGNHDDRAGDPPPHCAIDVVDEPLVGGGLALRHTPGEDDGLVTVAVERDVRLDAAAAQDGAYVIAGHVHPAYRLAARGDAVRLPCFVIGAQRALLPAFGEFTGGAAIAPRPSDRIFVTDGERVHAVPPRPDARAVRGPAHAGSAAR